jgi:hypothetical protein
MSTEGLLMVDVNKDGTGEIKCRELLKLKRGGSLMLGMAES